MIQRSAVPVEVQHSDHPESWQKLLANAIRDPARLLERLDLPATLLPGAEAGHRLFPVRVPAPYLARIEPGNPDDPLLRQVLPELAESHSQPGYVRDPLAEYDSAQSSASQGVIHKYDSRALLVVTGACAINCRYCFRRHFPYQEHQLGASRWDQPLKVLSEDSRINEVILSGGDPLAANDQILGRLSRRIASIPHIRRLRIHSRLPVVIPQRVCDELLDWLNAIPLQKVMVVHINHPAEIDAPVRRAMQSLRQAGVTLFNQSVLLRGINDDPQTLETLSEELFASGIIPYYLHTFDPVEGAAHFDPGDDTARRLTRDLLERLPGYLVPKLVREVPGEKAKWPLDLGLLPEH